MLEQKFLKYDFRKKSVSPKFKIKKAKTLMLHKNPLHETGPDITIK